MKRTTPRKDYHIQHVNMKPHRGVPEDHFPQGCSTANRRETVLDTQPTGEVNSLRTHPRTHPFRFRGAARRIGSNFDPNMRGQMALANFEQMSETLRGQFEVHTLVGRFDSGYFVYSSIYIYIYIYVF